MEAAASILPRKSKAWYASADGRRALVEIQNVHFDDEAPYYTIHLADGVERSTVRSRLTPATEEEAAGAEADEARARAEAAAAAAQARSGEDAIWDAVRLLEQQAAANGAPPAPMPVHEEARQRGHDHNHHPHASSQQAPPRPRGRAASPRRGPSPGKPFHAKPARSDGKYRDEKAAEVGGCCMACKGKRKSIYVQCAECKRTGVAESLRILCASCSRTCDVCEITLCPTCKRNVHTACRHCGARCRRTDFAARLAVDGCGLGKDVCCKCKAQTVKA